MAICAYCWNDRELCASHSIPDGFFKAISRRNNGKLITIPGGAGQVHLSQDSGKADLLCEACERLFNRRFDGPLVNAMKLWDRKIQQEGFSARIAFSPNQMAQSLASIFWRASVSGNDMYAHARVSMHDANALLSLVQGEEEAVLKLCSCSIRRLKDRRYKNHDGFTQDVVSQIIMPVSAHRLSWGRKKPTVYFGFSVVLQGFLCHLAIPRLPASKRNAPGFLHPKDRHLHAPPMHLLDYKPLMDSMVMGLAKHLDGQSTLKE
ncbi:hypothetical protein WNZ15_19570 [Roseibium sp. AS2]|uniref:hypothetical protein n=1 Tax=Roseibium sp. AS2 TaxID=3135781 RepID=UPI003178D640